MPELTSLEHLQPCLLDRLTDDVPGSAQESRAQRVVSHQRYRQGVLRDLEWLLNTGAPLPEDGRFKLRDFPEAQKSVLNYGMRHIAGLTAPNMDVLCREMMEVIRVFEPRIDPATLSVAGSTIAPARFAFLQAARVACARTSSAILPKSWLSTVQRIAGS